MVSGAAGATFAAKEPPPVQQQGADSGSTAEVGEGGESEFASPRRAGAAAAMLRAPAGASEYAALARTGRDAKLLLADGQWIDVGALRPLRMPPAGTHKSLLQGGAAPLLSSSSPPPPPP